MAKYYKKSTASGGLPKACDFGENTVEKREAKPIRVRKEALFVFFVALVIVAVACGFYLTAEGSKFDSGAQKGTLGARESVSNNASENMISIILNTSPYFEDGSAPGNIFFENPAHSGKLERLEIYLDATDELIYKSGYLEPGTYIDFAPLSVDLEAGEYKCTAVIYGYTVDTQEYIGRVAAGITVYVLN